MNERYEALGAFLGRFGWLADSHLHQVLFESTVDQKLTVVLAFRAVDHDARLADRTVRLTLLGVTEFLFEQAADWMRFETSSGVAISREDKRLFLDLGGPAWRTGNYILTDFVPSLPPRHLTVEEIRSRGCYFDFTDIRMDVLAASATQ